MRSHRAQRRLELGNNYNLPKDSLIMWEEAARPKEAKQHLAFHHPLRHSVWEDYETPFRQRIIAIHSYNQYATPVCDNLVFAEHMHAQHIPRLIVRDRDDYRFSSLHHDGERFLVHTPHGVKDYGEYLVATAQQAAQELVQFPFKDISAITQLQDGINEATRSPGINNKRLLSQMAVVLEAIKIAEEDRGSEKKDLFMLERGVYNALDDLLQQFPHVETKLWTDLRDILISSHVPPSPLYTYREILQSSNISVRANMRSGQFDVSPGDEPSTESTRGQDWIYGLVQKSYQRNKAFNLIHDALTLGVTTVFLAHAVQRYALAKVSFGDWLSMETAAHPLFYKPEPFNIVPNTITFDKDERLLLITGPTEAGKTTAVRTIGTNVLMAHAFGYACASKMTTPVFRRMLSSFIHKDNFEKGISLFKAESSTLNRHYNIIDDATFYAGDEVLRTSEPAVGTKLLPNVVTKMIAKGAMGAIATHYHDTARLLQQEEGVKCMYIDENEFYSLKDGVSKGGYAVDSAMRAGLHPDLVGVQYSTAPKPNIKFRVAKPCETHWSRSDPQSVPIAQVLSRHKPHSTTEVINTSPKDVMPLERSDARNAYDNDSDDDEQEF